MQVEVYDMLEKADNELLNNALINDESKALIESLELDGQKSLLNGKQEVRPYNVLSEQQRFVCANLFPVYTKIKEYSIGPVPYRILKEAVVAKDHFKYLYILHEAPAIVADPVLVGTNGEHYMWNDGQNKYNGMSLIARWGEALEPWEKLYEKAMEIFKKEIINSMKALKSEMERAVALMEQGVMPTNKQFNLQHINNFMPFRG